MMVEKIEVQYGEEQCKEEDEGTEKLQEEKL